MKLSIIILNYNTRGLLRQCLKAIYKNLPEFSHEIVVVDNNSKDKSVSMVQNEFPQVKLLALDRNLGYSGGNNKGLEVAQGEYLMILNPDVLVLKNSLSELVKFMEQNPNVGLAGPKFLNPDKTLQYSCYQFPSLLTPVLRRTPLGLLPFGKKMIAAYLMQDINHNEIQEVDWLLGGGLILRREVLTKVGLLDERFFLYFDDVDYARRARQAGFKVMYFPNSEMIHFHQRDSAGSPISLLTNKVARIHVISAIKYFLKWRGIS